MQTKNELPKRFIVVGTWRYRALPETRRFGIGVGIEGGPRERFVAGPEPGAADLVRIGLARYRIWQPGHAAGMQWGLPSGEARDCQVETAPEKMDGTHLTEEAAPEKLE